jgi:F-type H+-transporting ATPase subunit c
MRIINNNKEKNMSLLRKTTIGLIGISSVFAANPGAAFAPLGAGMIVIGAAIGIGMFASAAANSIARQPEAAKAISGAVNLPLFLLEGVAIIALVVCILAVVG